MGTNSRGVHFSSMIETPQTLLDWTNVLLTVATIGFGAIGYLAPSYTMEKLALKPDGGKLGYSEIRAANGALFIGLGTAAIFIGSPVAFAMIGFAYAGAAFGRFTSIIADDSGTPTSWSFLAVEIVFAASLIWFNLT